MNVNFKSKFLFYNKVEPTQKLHTNGNLYFVEISPYSNSDYHMTKELARNWFNDSNFIKYIADELTYQRYTTKPGDFYPMRFFGLTKQSRDFENLKVEDMVGIAQVAHEGFDKYNIDFVETNSAFSKEITGSKFNDNASRLIKYILDYFKHKTVNVHALKSEIDSYAKLGFKPTGHWTLKDIIQVMERLPVSNRKF